MRKHNPFTTAALVASVALAVPAWAAPTPNTNHQQQQQHGQQQLAQGTLPHHVDLVIALDTSSSMDGLIDGARQKLWDVVNLLSAAKPTPELRVGLISYGNDGYSAQTGWVRKESDLTTDLDGIYSKLFALRTNGGTEYVARAVKDATNDMQWSQDQKALKIIFVAGNEPANQDPVVPVEAAVQAAREKGIFVNSIYCGSEGAGEASLWRTVASLGAGRFAAIDQNQQVAIATPMDAKLNALSHQLNDTYVAYGAGGQGRAQNQIAQDKNAGDASSAAAASRAVAKASPLYSNEEWDLVDAKAKGKKDVGHMKAAELPAPLRGMSAGEREAFVAKKAQDRAAIQKEIATVNAQRDAYVKAERAKRAKAGTKALDDALDGAIKTEAEAQGFAF